MRAPAPREPSADSLLRPSDPAEDEGQGVRTGESAQQRARALQRGALVHRLLQSLPDVAPEARRDAALRYLARNAGGWSEDERAALATQVLALIGDIAICLGVRARQPRRSLDRRAAGPAGTAAGAGFGPDRPAGGDAGRSPDRRLQDQPCPAADVAEAPAAYIRQLALYRAVLAELYPQKPVRAALLWTETPEMMEISAPALDAQLAAIIRRDDRA